jgi:hypothetical protein
MMRVRRMQGWLVKRLMMVQQVARALHHPSVCLRKHVEGMMQMFD